jgi:hypothetical protein
MGSSKLAPRSIVAMRASRSVRHQRHPSIDLVTRLAANGGTSVWPCRRTLGIVKQVEASNDPAFGDGPNCRDALGSLEHQQVAVGARQLGAEQCWRARRICVSLDARRLHGV